MCLELVFSCSFASDGGIVIGVVGDKLGFTTAVVAGVGVMGSVDGVVTGF